MIRQILQANAILIIQFTVRSLIPLLLVPHIVKIIGLKEFGNLAVIMAWGNYGAVIVQYAFNLTGPKHIAEITYDYRSATQTIFFDTVLVKLFLFIIVSFVMEIIFTLMSPLKSSSSIAWLLFFILPAASVFNSIWFLQVKDRFLNVCLIAISDAVVVLITGLFFIRKNNTLSVDITVVVYILSPLIIGLGTFLFSAKLLGGTKGFSVDFSRLYRELKEGWHIFLSQFVSMLYTASGPILIDSIINAKSAGAYSVTMRIINALMAAVLLTHTAAYPRLASTYKRDKKAYSRILKFVVIMYLTVASWVIFIGYIMSEQIINFIYGEIQQSYFILFYWGLAWLALGIFGPVVTGYLAVSDQGDKIWPLTVKVLIVSFVLGVPLTYFVGNVGWLAGLVIAQLVILYEGYKFWRIRNEW